MFRSAKSGVEITGERRVSKRAPTLVLLSFHPVPSVHQQGRNATAIRGNFTD